MIEINKTRPNFKELVKQFKLNKMTKEELHDFLVINRHHFLDEFLLFFYIHLIFNNYEILHNKKFKDTRFIPDFYIPKLNIIIEFDGPTHYTNNDVVVNDDVRDNYFNNIGIEVIRIPNFIQFTKKEIEYLFGNVKDKIDLNYNNIYSTYKHGFWHEKVILPCSYCVRGNVKYINIIKKLIENNNEFKNDIIESYIYKVKEKQSFRKVFSPINTFELELFNQIPLNKSHYANDYNNLTSEIQTFKY